MTYDLKANQSVIGENHDYEKVTFLKFSGSYVILENLSIYKIKFRISFYNENYKVLLPLSNSFSQELGKGINESEPKSNRFKLNSIWNHFGLTA